MDSIIDYSIIVRFNGIMKNNNKSISIHAYEGKVQKIEVRCRMQGRVIWVDVIDKGIGIENISKAMEPMFTTKPEKDRSGMGFTFMEAFMDEVTVESQVGDGTTVHMKKTIGR